MMYHGDDSRPQDQAADTAMTALYRQLDQHDLPADTPFDTAAGLRDLTGRIRITQPVPSEETPEDDTPSSPGEGSTPGSLGVVIAGAVVAAGLYLARRWARKMMQPPFHPRSFDPASGRGEHAHLQDERW